jgi:predicted AAA+ superfamily ATPase
MRDELVKYLQLQISNFDDRVKRYTHNPMGEEFPKRLIYNKLQNYLESFLEKKLESRMVVMPGFRGVGKTTVMAQICEIYKTRVENILFLSIEEAKDLFDCGVMDVVFAYEEILGYQLESAKEPIIIFLDEVQVDSKWAVSLKILFEKTVNVFFCCSGSSALELQNTQDLARRAIFEKVYPMSFAEYQLTSYKILPLVDIGERIKNAIYYSKNSAEIYQKLFLLKPKINKYWSKVNRLDIRKYLSYGSLPFSRIMPNETAIYNSISSLLDKIIKIDIAKLGCFQESTISSIKKILFAISDNDTTSFYKLEEVIGIARGTLIEVFSALEKAELLIKIQAYGSNMSVVKKPSKYLFMSSAVRMSFFYFSGIENTFLTRQGKLLEDVVGSHLYREFVCNGVGSLRYDNSKGGADFILQIANNKQIIIEVGMGKKDAKQILNSSKKIKSDYNVVYSENKLGFDQDNNIIFVPLDYFFLM